MFDLESDRVRARRRQCPVMSRSLALIALRSDAFWMVSRPMFFGKFEKNYVIFVL